MSEPKPKLPRKPRKAPVCFSQAVAARVLAAIATGATVKDAARQTRLGQHGAKTIYRWAQRFPEFEEALAEARKIGALELADRSIEVANELLRRARQGHLQKGEVAATREWLGHIRYLLARHYPARYGERAQGAAISVIIETSLDLNEAKKSHR